jgi:hypothetical protein
MHADHGGAGGELKLTGAGAMGSGTDAALAAILGRLGAD